MIIDGAKWYAIVMEAMDGRFAEFCQWRAGERLAPPDPNQESIWRHGFSAGVEWMLADEEDGPEGWD